MAISVSADFNAVQHTLPPFFVANRLFGVGDATTALLSSDGKTIDQLVAEMNCRACPWPAVVPSSSFWGTTGAPSTLVNMGTVIQDAVVAAGGGWQLKFNIGPPGVWEQLQASPPTPNDPADTPGTYPKTASTTDDTSWSPGNVPFSPTGWGTWANWAKSRWGESYCAGAIADNEWENRAYTGTAYNPYWYHTGSGGQGSWNSSCDWAFVNWREWATTWNGIISTAPCYGYCYSLGASSTPEAGYDFKSRMHRWLYGEGYGSTPDMTNVSYMATTYSWPHGSNGNDNYGATAYHSYGGGILSADSSTTTAAIVSQIQDHEGFYVSNTDWFRTIVPSNHKFAQEEWSDVWPVWSAGLDNQVGNQRTAFSDVCGFMLHANNQASWNCQFITFWGIGPKRYPSTAGSGGASDSKYINVNFTPTPHQLIRMPDYYSMKQMIGHCALTYPVVVSRSVGSDGRALACRASSGNTCAVMVANLSTATQNLSVSGFTTVTGITQLANTGYAVDTPLSTIGSTIPSTIAALEALYIEGTYTPSVVVGGVSRGRLLGRGASW